jgi:hypothetical protein
LPVGRPVTDCVECPADEAVCLCWLEGCFSLIASREFVPVGEETVEQSVQWQARLGVGSHGVGDGRVHACPTRESAVDERLGSRRAPRHS